MRKYYMLLLAVAYLRTAAANNLIVSAGGDLQAALNAAQPGDTVTIAAGATFVGHYYLAPNPGPQWITIQSSAMNSLPPAGSRVSMTQASAMPKLMSPDENAVLSVGTGANYYHIRGIEFTAAPGIYSLNVIAIGAGKELSNSQLAHDLDFDRDYIHGDPVSGGKRGIALNGGATTIQNCYLSAFTSTGQDTQAISGWNGPGPYTITNNYLEAGTEIVAFGGAVVSIPMNIPSDILIKNNTFFKPLSWRPGDPSYAGVPVWAKNHIELKNAQRVTIDSNTFTNNWVGADQGGYVFVFGVRVEGGMVPWAVVKDVTITNNMIRHAGAGALFMGQDSLNGAGSAGNFLIQNNVWEDLRNDWGDGRLFLVEDRVLGVTFDHNTAFETGWLLVFDGSYNFNVNFTNNIVNVGWGVIGPGTGVGAPSFSVHSIGGSFLNNVLIGNTGYPYPVTTSIVPSMDQVGFVNYQAENFLLASSSPFKGMATDGTDIGAHLQASNQKPVIPTGWFNLISKNSGECLDVTGISSNPGASLQQWPCWGGNNQAFKLTPVNGGYAITPRNSGLTVEIGGGPGVTWPGAPVIQWSYWGGSSQIWQIVPTSDGYFNLKPTNDGLCMDTSGSSQNNGAPVVQATCTGGDSQKWSFNVVQ